MTYEYYTFPGNSGTLVQIFNAVAMICGGGDFAGAASLVAMLGFIVAICMGLFKADLKGSVNYILVIAFIWLGLMVPKSSVVIIESAGHNMNPVAQKVDNVPFGLAVSASIISKIGVWMTTQTEQVFTLPNDLNYSQTGILFGNKLYQQIYNSTITDPTLQNDWATFMYQCSFFDMNMYHFYSMDELLHSADLMTTLGKTNQVLYTTISDGPNTNKSTAMNCTQAYAKLRAATLLDIDNSLIPAKAQEIMGHLGWTERVGPNATDIYAAMGDASLQYMFKNVASTAQKSIQQAALINMIKRAEIRNASAMQDQQNLAIALSTAQAERQWVTSQLTGLALASDCLPVVRAALEGILIGIFPFMLLIAVISGVMAFKTLMNYLMLLFWIQLWAPMAAIINLILTSYSASNIYSQLHGLDAQSLSSSYGILQAAVSKEAMAGYLLWLVPPLCFAIVSAGKGMANSMISLSSSGQSLGNREGATIAQGNANMGNVSYNNSSANKDSRDAVYSTPGVARSSSSVGSYSFTNGQTNSARAQAAKFDLPVSSSSSISAAENYSQQASKSIQSAHSQEAIATAASTLGNSYAMGYMAKVGRDSSAGQSIMSNLSAEQRQNVSQVLQAADTIDEKYGVKHSSSTASALNLALGIGANGSFDLGSKEGQKKAGKAVKGLLKQSATESAKSGKSKFALGMNGELGLGTRTEAKITDELTRSVVSAASALQQRGVSFDKSLGKSIANSDSFRSALSSGDSLAQNTQTNLAKAESASQIAKTSYSAAENYQSMARKAAESKATISVDNSSVVGQAALNNGDTLGNMYKNPVNKSVVGAGAAQGLTNQSKLQADTSGTSFSPTPEEQASDKPSNTVNATHARQAANLQNDAGKSFANTQKLAKDSGLSTSAIPDEISKKQASLTGQSKAANQQVQSAIDKTGGLNHSDATNLKQHMTDANNATSWFQHLNSNVTVPDNKSEGNNGSAFDMFNDIGIKAVNQQSFNPPDGKPTTGFTDAQNQIQDSNKKNQPSFVRGIMNIIGITNSNNQVDSAVLKGDSTNYRLGAKKTEGNKDPKP